MEHQIHTDNALTLHYGTRLGVIFEDYTAANGFGPSSDQYGAVFEANLGLDYDIKRYQTLSLEGVRSQNELYNQIGSQVRFMYECRF